MFVLIGDSYDQELAYDPFKFELISCSKINFDYFASINIWRNKQHNVVEMFGSGRFSLLQVDGNDDI